jgi:uncharacterized protein YbjQ (UPF0145 family)
MMSEESKATMNITAESVGAALLQAFVLEAKRLPDIWDKLSEAQQNEVLDRMRDCIADQVREAVYQLASQGRATVIGELEQITIKNGAKAVVKMARSNESLADFYEAQGQCVFVSLNNASEHLSGMDTIKGEADQRALTLGHEYHDA